LKSILGGKGHAAVWRTLLNQIPPHDEFIEPFLGHGTLLRKKRPAARTVGCDLDDGSLDAVRRVARGIELYKVCGIEWLKQEFGFYSFPAPVERTMADVGAALYGGPGRSPAGPIRFVYCDPPYPHSTRTSDKRYEFEMTDEQHGELLTVLRSIDALVMVSSYPNELYARELRGRRTFTFEGYTRGGVRTEQVWMNYPEPKILHDWRFAGANKRQGERIRRRVEKWRAMAGKMLPVERQAVIAALVEDGPAAGQSNGGFAAYRACVRCSTLRPVAVESCPVCRNRSVASRLVFSGVF